MCKQLYQLIGSRDHRRALFLNSLTRVRCRTRFPFVCYCKTLYRTLSTTHSPQVRLSENSRINKGRQVRQTALPRGTHTASRTVHFETLPPPSASGLQSFGLQASSSSESYHASEAGGELVPSDGRQRSSTLLNLYKVLWALRRRIVYRQTRDDCERAERWTR